MLDSAKWAISSVVERFLHTEEATGSIPVSPTTSPFQTPQLTVFIRVVGAALILDRTSVVGYTLLCCAIMCFEPCRTSEVNDADNSMGRRNVLSGHCGRMR